MRLSKQRAAERYGESFACTVYVGDGVWDARACRSVGIPFIGIGTGSRATRLSAEGAVCVFPDFNDADLFLRSMYEITNAAKPCAAANPGRCASIAIHASRGPGR
jgi:FMN phosphatase YigB (HAD superfamily)